MRCLQIDNNFIVISETIVWNRLSSNAGTKQIILSESNTEVQVPEGGYYYTLATLKIVGMNCKTTLNGRVSIRFCLLHNNDQVKCTDDSHPLSTADVWARTISLTVPYISMSSGDRLRFVTSNPGCIYDDGKVSVLEIHQITWWLPCCKTVMYIYIAKCKCWSPIRNKVIWLKSRHAISSSTERHRRVCAMSVRVRPFEALRS